MSKTHTDAVKKRALELYRLGLTREAVQKKMAAEGMRVAAGTLSDWKAEAGNNPEPDVAGPDRVDVDYTDEELVRLPAKALGNMLTAVQDRLQAEMKKPNIDPAVTARLTQQARDLAKAHVIAKPPPKHDPLTDPSTRRLASEVIKKIEDMVMAAEDGR